MNDWSHPLSAIAELLAALIASVSLIWSVRIYRRSAWISHYGELDRMYADLLSLAVEKPHLRQGHDTERDNKQRHEYDTYAYMVWNFIEAVHDRIYIKDSTKELRETWEITISVEHNLFGA